jgi:beta-glucanase (GH16 family)
LNKNDCKFETVVCLAAEPATLTFPWLSTDTNLALHYYSPDNAKTSNGVLNLTTVRKINNYKAFDEDKKKFFADKKYIQSAMVQGWNKFCFTGGIIEYSAKLPGNPRVGGLWPARKCQKKSAGPRFGSSKG